MAEIFLMEDSPALRRVLIRQIREAGHNVVAFEDGQESYDAELMNMADVLITDLSMPKADGSVVIRNVLNLRPELPIIVITGEVVEKFTEVDKVDCVLRKPFQEDALIGAIEMALHNPQNMCSAD